MKKNLSLAFGFAGLFLMLVQALFVLLEPAETFFEHTNSLFERGYAVYAYAAHDQIRLLLLGAAIVFFFAAWLTALYADLPTPLWARRLGLTLVIASACMVLVIAFNYICYVDALKSVEEARKSGGYDGGFPFSSGFASIMVSLCSGFAVSGMLLAWVSRFIKRESESQMPFGGVFLVLVSAVLFVIGGECIHIALVFYGRSYFMIPAAVFIALGGAVLAVRVLKKIKVRPEKSVMLYEIAVLLLMLYCVFCSSAFHLYGNV